MTVRRGRRRKKLLDNHTKKKGYWKLKEEALDHILWSTHFGRGYGPFVRQKTEWISFTPGGKIPEFFYFPRRSSVECISTTSTLFISSRSVFRNMKSATQKTSFKA